MINILLRVACIWHAVNNVWKPIYADYSIYVYAHASNNTVLNCLTRVWLESIIIGKNWLLRQLSDINNIGDGLMNSCLNHANMGKTEYKWFFVEITKTKTNRKWKQKVSVETTVHNNWTQLKWWW